LVSKEVFPGEINAAEILRYCLEVNINLNFNSKFFLGALIVKICQILCVVELNWSAQRNLIARAERK